MRGGGRGAKGYAPLRGLFGVSGIEVAVGKYFYPFGSNKVI